MEKTDEIEFDITFTAFVKPSPIRTVGQQIESLIDDLNTVIYEKHKHIDADCFWVAQKPSKKEQK
jgi:hypothetical protein